MEPNISSIPHFLNRRDDGPTARAFTTNELLGPERIAHEITSSVHTSPTLHTSLNISSIYRQPLSLSEHHSFASRLVCCKCLKHPTLRFARYITFLTNPVGGPFPSNAIICLLAGRGQVAPRNPSKVRDERENARTPFEQESMLECAHCKLLIPIADLVRFTPRSAVTCTEDLISQVLAPQHMNECSELFGGDTLGEDDACLLVMESQASFAQRNDDTTLLGMRLIFVVFTC